MEMRCQLISDCRPCYRYNHQQLITPLFVRVRAKQTCFNSTSTMCFHQIIIITMVIIISSCLPNKRTSWLKLRPEMDEKQGKNGGGVLDYFYKPVDNQVVSLNRQNCLGVPETAMCFGTTNDWLCFVDPSDDCPVHLYNPFSGGEYTNDVIRLPTLATMSNVW